VQAGVAARLALRICDRRTVLAGLGLQVLGMAGMGLAPTGALFWLANLPAGLGVVSQPALQSLMSRTVSPAEQGRLQGVVSAIASLASIAAPVAFTQLFAWTIARNQAWSGVTILVAAALSLAALTLVALTPERQNSQGRR
jgi:DHA1 family tetracycline resistance protein-like MFS transporter